MKKFLHRYGRAIFALAVVAAFCATLPLLFQQSRAIETGSWGLSFRTEGQPPIGNASAEALRQYDAVYLGNTSAKKIYLTFDAGYENGCTGKILDALQKHNVHAAFFLVGNYLEQNPVLVRRMLDEGHTVGNHTYHHYDMSKLATEAAFRKELTSLLSQNVTFDDFSLEYYPTTVNPATGLSPRRQMELIYETCVNYASHFVPKRGKNLLMSGEPGLGKTTNLFS